MQNLILVPNNLANLDRKAVRETGVIMQMPVYLGLKLSGSDKWLLPIEPSIAVRGRNVITRRTIAKEGKDNARGRGSVKELWTKDDYEIILSGILHGEDENELPRELITRLANVCSQPGPVYLESALTSALGILQIAITDFDFPVTVGISWQKYEIKGYSDAPFDLLI